MMRRTGTESGNGLYTTQRNARRIQSGIVRRRSSCTQIVFMQKCTIIASAILILTTLILPGFGIRAFADSTRSSQELYTYYTSIELEAGDTLWDIAQEYTFGTGVDAQDYIDEVCSLNHLTDADSIHEGNYIVIPYYCYEEK